MNTKKNNKTFDSLIQLDLVKVQAIKPRLFNFQLKNNTKRQKNNRQKQKSQSSHKISYSTQRKFQPFSTSKNKNQSITNHKSNETSLKLPYQFQTISYTQNRNGFRGLMYKRSFNQRRKKSKSFNKTYQSDYLSIKPRSVLEKRLPHQNISTISLEEVDKHNIKDYEKYHIKNRRERMLKCRTAQFNRDKNNKNLIRQIQFQNSRIAAQTKQLGIFNI